MSRVGPNPVPRRTRPLSIDGGSLGEARDELDHAEREMEAGHLEAAAEHFFEAEAYCRLAKQAVEQAIEELEAEDDDDEEDDDAR